MCTCKTPRQKEYLLELSGFFLQLQSEIEFPIPENLALFQVDREAIPAGAELCRYELCFTDAFPEPQGELVAETEDIRVYSNGALEQRYISHLGNPEIYACYQELGPNEIRVFYLPSRMDELLYDTCFCALLALERQLLPQRKLVLHCAYNEYRQEAILFSAPSETGKTTHANLWNQYLGSRTVNGDKAMLIREADGWYACGWPVCGSSEICHREAYPIRAIVMIHRAAENSAYPLAARDAFRQIYTQITFNRWNPEHQLLTMELIEQLIGEVPVYQLNCNISEAAVQCIKNEIERREEKL